MNEKGTALFVVPFLYGLSGCFLPIADRPFDFYKRQGEKNECTNDENG